MKNKIKKHHLVILIIFAAIVLLLILLMNSQADAIVHKGVYSDETLPERISRSLENVPEYGVFDWITFKLEQNGKVILSGSVVFRKTSREAQSAIEKIAEISEIENRINILPISKADDHIRNTVWKKLENNPRLESFIEGADPKVHVIVNQRKIDLFGTVETESDAKLFESTVRKVPGILSVDNHLHITKIEESVRG